jgi:mRNA interferase MazF
MKEILRGDIWVADLNPVVGSEQGGRRPVLVLQNDIGNRHSPTVIVAAITSRDKNNLPTHVRLDTDSLSQRSIVLLEHIRTLDKTRLQNRCGTVTETQMKAVEQAIDISLGKQCLEEML